MEIHMNYNYIVRLTVVALMGALPHTKADVNLGSAESFAVLGGSTVANTGDTVVNGNLGVSPGTVITGFGPGVVNGTTYSSGSVALQAANDASAAYSPVTSIGDRFRTKERPDQGGVVLKIKQVFLDPVL
jgi:uncharacterized Zn-binding protein involved in type VI secretion